VTLNNFFVTFGALPPPAGTWDVDFAVDIFDGIYQGTYKDVCRVTIL